MAALFFDWERVLANTQHIMKKIHLRIYHFSIYALSGLLFLTACETKNQQQTEQKAPSDSVAIQPEDVVVVSNQSEFLRTIVGNTTNHFFRGLDLGSDINEIKTTETFEIFEDSTSHVSYTHETENFESVDIRYSLDKNKTIHDIQADVYLNTKNSANSLWDQFDNYFSGRYVATKTIGKTKIWKAKEGVFVKLMDVSEGKDFGLQIKMGPDAAKNL
jgi:hypothetical protein